MRDSFLLYSSPDLGDEELAEVAEVLRSGWITTGPKARLLESEFGAAVGAKHAIAVSSCTAAMHLALEASGLLNGEEVITTPYTFASTAAVILHCGARPVLVDIQPDTLNINPDLIEAAITERTRAIIPVHMAGLPADLDAIGAIAQRHGLAVIQDAAHAFPAAYRGRAIGSIGDITCFSFYATKTITTGEGGMITTDDDRLAERCRIMALHGISKDAWKRYTAEGSWYYEIIAPGFKANMPDLAAAVGLAQLRKASMMAERRRAIANFYNAAFAELPELQIPQDRADCQHSWHMYMLRLNLDRLRIDRGRFVEELKQRGIGTSVHFIPLHLHPYYRETYGYRPEDYPVSYREYQREISLPIYSKMTDRDAEDVVEAVSSIVEKYGV